MSTATAPLIGVDAWGFAQDTDRRFKRTMAAILLPFIVLMIVIPFIHLAGLQKGGGDTLERRYVSLLPDAEIADAVEEPKPEPEAEDKPAEEPKPAEQVKPEPAKPKAPEAKPEPTREQQVENAREKAAQTGVLAMADQLKALRDNSLQGLDAARPLSTDTVTAQAGTGASGGSAGGGAIAQSAAASSGGISGAGTGETRRAQTGAGLGQRRTTTVDSPLGRGPDKPKPGQSGDKALGGRTLEEIQLAFDRSKGAFYSIFNRALRDNPNLRGKMVVSLTIAPNGAVTACELVSSELGDPDLERKVIQRVMLMNFGAKSVPPFTYPNFPIIFQPA
jgi:protein TonB